MSGIVDKMKASPRQEGENFGSYLDRIVHGDKIERSKQIKQRLSDINRALEPTVPQEGTGLSEFDDQLIGPGKTAVTSAFGLTNQTKETPGSLTQERDELMFELEQLKTGRGDVSLGDAIRGRQVSKPEEEQTTVTETTTEATVSSPEQQTQTIDTNVQEVKERPLHRFVLPSGDDAFDQATSRFLYAMEEKDPNRALAVRNAIIGDELNGKGMTNEPNGDVPVEKDIISDLMGVIQKGESNEADPYGAVNKSVANYNAAKAKDIKSKTIEEILEMQANDELGAVGRYQIIESTMRDFVAKHPHVNGSDVFNEETQDKFVRYLMDMKRPTIGKFIREGEGNAEDVAIQLAMEFASIKLPRDVKKDEFGKGAPREDRKAGESFYEGISGNKGLIEADEILSILQT